MEAVVGSLVSAGNSDLSMRILRPIYELLPGRFTAKVEPGSVEGLDVSIRGENTVNMIARPARRIFWSVLVTAMLALLMPLRRGPTSLDHSLQPMTLIVAGKNPVSPPPAIRPFVIDSPHRCGAICLKPFSGFASEIF